jgi:hypothetical protein
VCNPEAGGCTNVPRQCPAVDACHIALPCNGLNGACATTPVQCAEYDDTSRPGRCGLGNGCDPAAGCKMDYEPCVCRGAAAVQRARSTHVDSTRTHAHAQV